MNNLPEKRENRIGTYISTLVLGGVALWVMNKLPSWNIPYLLDSYQNALPAINLSLYVQIAMNLVLLFYHPRFFHHLSQVVTAGFSIFAISTILRIFPLDFSSIVLPTGVPSINLMARIALGVAIGGAAIGALVHAVKFLAHIFRGEVED